MTDMTPAIRLLRREAVPYTEHPYEHDPDAASYGEEAAARLGVDAARVYTTLVCQAEGVGLVLVLVPSSRQLNLKSLRNALGVKKVVLADPGVAERATGYVIGGISPLGGRKRLPVMVDDSLLTQESVFVSAGRRGLQIELAPADLMRLTEATASALAG